ncbi:MAG: phosphopentomutase [Clostridiales bacterium]|nr:phosphopentomutase [Clostridiales bacterium]
MLKRVFIIVLDSFGIGELPDAADYGDVGSNTLLSISKSPKFHIPNLRRLGLLNIDGVTAGTPASTPEGCFARMNEMSRGKDTTIGHWEMSGIISEKPLPTFPHGFPDEVIEKLEKTTGRKALCNRPYSGTEVIAKYGQEHVQTGALIVYTSADSVLQIAAHEDVVPLELLYEYCQMARDIMTGEFGVGRIIARPFIGDFPNFKRTPNRHDFSLAPPKTTMLDLLMAKGFETLGVGKINDIFAGKSISWTTRTQNNRDGMEKTIELQDRDFNGLCFVNLVDFDMLFGHRNDVDGYANAMSEVDVQLGEFMDKMKQEDVLIVTADHGCDPATESTDHSREYVPMLIYGKQLKKGVNLGTRKTFSDIAATVLGIFGVENTLPGESVLGKILNR